MHQMNWQGRKDRCWWALTSPEIGAFLEREKKEYTTIILPVGSCEQHGPHLPVGTDTLLGFCLACAVSARCKHPTMVLPPVWMGYSPHHMGAPGTVTVSEETLISVVYDLCESVIQHNASNILLLNSHGGNEPLLVIVANKIARRFGKSPIVVTYWKLIADEIDQIRKSSCGGMGHGGEFETSLALYLIPELVKFDKAISAVQPGDKYFSPDLFAKNTIHCYVDYLKLSPSGVIGDPLAGSEQEGSQLFALLIERLCKLIDDCGRRNISVLNYGVSNNTKEE